MKNLLKILIVFTLASTAVSAVELPRLFADHMVLQRDEPIAVFGRGDPGAVVFVKLSNGKHTRGGNTNVDKFGGFKLYLEPLPVGRGYTMEVSSGEQALEYTDVSLGDVWVCSGQSNMAWVLTDTNESEKEIAASLNQDIRLFTVPKTNAESPVPEVTGGTWQICDPTTSGNFSAVGYYFGKFLSKNLDVPIGLIHSSWGGTMVESWTSLEALYSQEDPKRFSEQALETTTVLTDSPMEARINELFEPFNIGRAKDKRINAFKRTGDLLIFPTNLYNGMIHPLLDYPIKGAIWYQGEANAQRAYEYRKLMPLMIEDWRNKWNLGDFPFYLVQLANYMERKEYPADSEWAELREAQCMTMDLPNTGMAVIIDIGEAGDIHPKNKRDVGYRLALQALKKTYGQKDLLATGPVLKSACLDHGSIRLSFSGIGSGLVLRDSVRSGFEVASKDGDFHWADAELAGDKIILKSDAVKEPHYVRYAWADNPYVTLFNKEGLPASPFRTDKRLGMTHGKKYVPMSGSSDPYESFKGNAREAFLENLEFDTVGAYRIAASGHDGNTPAGLFDGKLNTRWSCLGLESMLLVDLGAPTSVKGLEMATFNGDVRHTIFQLSVSNDLKDWKESFFGATSGTTNELEAIEISKAKARYLLFTFYGNTDNFWNSISEIQINP